ncbi:glycyl-radical enzyme activating protein [Geobacter sp. DSM 9736]|uniref:glycyl-radical enzyme activating protein n=1 Tax=Geobacter sp. DSM 9736 TaxID=1277350 RepID=UPI000B4FD579|nr:glycyl-radical enzyme activating protein [Geobacter sp. DSM 9736]SNB47001.1 pyruvate formate lyase activating enzyme [Geobacter sp. DSM 9736]
MIGRIFNYQRYCIHDGPGIRSVVFFSGCTLRCQWCCNPESYMPESPQHYEVSLDQLFDLIQEDKAFYRKSQGGVTLSGGEPLLQPDFAAALLEKCRDQNIGTAIETAGDVPWGALSRMDGLVDWYLYDLKAIDNSVHFSCTGTDNTRILANFEKLCAKGEQVILRVPLIPGINIHSAFAHSIGRFVSRLSVQEIHLLPYHRMGEAKYRQLGLNYPLEGLGDALIEPGGRNESVEEFKVLLQNYHSNILIGG